jgi:hypothetical protein
MKRIDSDTQVDGKLSIGTGNTVFVYPSAVNILVVGTTNNISGSNSAAIGTGNIVKGNNSFAEGTSNQALGSESHAEGKQTTASSPFSHTEGRYTVASSNYAHAEGHSTIASGDSAHSEGFNTTAKGAQAHAEGRYTTAGGDGSHTEGKQTTASGVYSHSEGFNTIAANRGSHSEGFAGGQYGASSGRIQATGFGSHAEGYSYGNGNIIASGWGSHAEGMVYQNSTIAFGRGSHAEGYRTTAKGDYTHAEGYKTTASGTHSHSEGNQTIATNTRAHSEGYKTNATGPNSHTEGNQTRASGNNTHAEGYKTYADGTNSHAEGKKTTAGGQYSHAAGKYANALRDNTFVWSDGINFFDQGQQTFNVFATNGTYISGGNLNVANSVICGNVTVNSSSISTIPIKVVSISGQTANLQEWQNLSGGPVEYITPQGFKAIRYRDEYVGGDWVLGAGGASPDVTTVTISGFGYRVYGFDGGNTLENMSNSFEVPHDLAFDELNNETVFMEAHVHWLPSTNNTGSVIWYFNWTYLPLNGAPIAESQLSVTATVSANQQYFHKISAFESGGVVKIPKPSSGFGIGDMILFDVRRVPTGDTYPDDALLLKCALHVPTNDFGSRQRYIK